MFSSQNFKQNFKENCDFYNGLFKAFAKFTKGVQISNSVQNGWLPVGYRSLHQDTFSNILVMIYVSPKLGNSKLMDCLFFYWGSVEFVTLPSTIMSSGWDCYPFCELWHRLDNVKWSYNKLLCHFQTSTFAEPAQEACSTIICNINHNI